MQILQDILLPFWHSYRCMIGTLLLLLLGACQAPVAPDPSPSNQPNDTIAEAQRLFQTARERQQAADYAAAIEGFKQCIRHNESATDTATLSALRNLTNDALLQLMNSYQSAGQPEECAAYFDSLMQRPSDALVAYNLRDLYSIAAYAFSRTECTDAAELIMDQALRFSSSREQAKDLFRDYAYAAAVYFSNPERQEDVIKYAKLGLEQAKLCEDTSGAQYLTSLLGKLYKRMGRVQEAILLFEESVKESNRQHNLLGEINSYDALAELLIYWELYTQANLYVDRALALIQQIESGETTQPAAKNPMVFGSLYLTKGQILCRMGQCDSAYTYYQTAEQYVRTLPYNSGMGNVDVQMGALLIEKPEGVAEGKQRLQQASRQGTLSIQASAYYHLAHLALKEGHEDEGLQLLDSVYWILNQAETPIYLPGIYYDTALRLALQRNDTERIRRYAEAYLKEMEIYNDAESVNQLADMLSGFYVEEQELKTQLVEAELRSKQLLWGLSISVSLLITGILLLFFANRVKVYKMRQRMANQQYTILLSELRTVESDLKESRQKATYIQKALEVARKESQLTDLLGPEMDKKTREGELRTAFQLVHPHFLDRLAQLAPGITPREEFTAILIALYQTSDQISELMSISLGSVNTMRYRLRGKLQLDSNESLEKVILQILQESETMVDDPEQA